MAVEINSPPTWLKAFLECLRTPVRQDRFESIRDGLRQDASELLGLMLERGFLARFDSESDTVAAFSARHRRPYSQSAFTSALDPPEGEALGPPDKLAGGLTDLLLARSSADCQASVAFDAQSLRNLLRHAYGPWSGFKTKDRRPAPAAGGLRSLQLFVHVAESSSLRTYKYCKDGDFLDGVSRQRATIADLCNDQAIVRDARAQVTFVYDTRTNSPKYGARGLDFALLEAGHAAQNLTLAATALGIGSRCIGSLSHPIVCKACDLRTHQVPIYACALF